MKMTWTLSILVSRDDGPHEDDPNMRDREVVLNHRVDHNTIRLLHRQDVRDETVTAEVRTVETFSSSRSWLAAVIAMSTTRGQ